MSANRKMAYGILGLLAGALLTAGVAEAQTAASAAGAPAADAAAAPQKAKPKPKAGTGRVDVVVTNDRAVPLTALVASPSGSPDSKKIAGPLAAGKKVVVHLAHDKACLFDIHGDYADGTSTEAEGVALCKDKKIDLVE
ncbi:MAG TPA: hypothetical protein VGH40_19745 [Roseiarcus sp.]